MNDVPAADSRHVVHEAIGHDLTLPEAASTIGLGVVSLIVAGVLPALLGALADEHRLSVDLIGLCAAAEALSMGISTALAGIMLPPRRLRSIAVAASLLLAALDLAGLGSAGTGVLIIRLIAGIPEGVLLWITVAMIIRSAVPERWAGVLFTASTATQFVLALAFAAQIIPRFGADGGFVALAAVTLLGVAIAPWCPKAFAPLPQTQGGSAKCRRTAARKRTRTAHRIDPGQRRERSRRVVARRRASDCRNADDRGAALHCGARGAQSVVTSLLAHARSMQNDFALHRNNCYRLPVDATRGCDLFRRIGGG